MALDARTPTATRSPRPSGCSSTARTCSTRCRRDGPARRPPAALIGRLRGAIPAPIAIELVFDGPAERGLRGERIASGLTVRYSGAADRRRADPVDWSRTSATADGADDTAALLVVTDDRDLRHGCAAARGADGRLGMAPRPARIGSAARRRRSATAAAAAADEPARATGPPTTATTGRRAGSPGRGATTKKGNPRKAPRTGVVDW